MSRGIYITVNDKVTEQTLAFMNSLRFYDPHVPVVLIPYDEDYQKIAQILGEKYAVTVYPNLALVEQLSQKIFNIFGSNLLARPNQFRKQACWFGNFERFLYIDTDIIVFEKIINNLKYLDYYDFLCCDYQHRGGITNVFSPIVIENNIFSKEELQDIFNGGFWASKKGIFTEESLFTAFAECAKHLEYFDFSQKTSDQPIINYTILKRVPKRLNLVRTEGNSAGNWAGSPNFKRDGDILKDIKSNLPLKYLHWAGIRIEPGCPYWDIWKHYRYLGDPNPPEDMIGPTQPQWQRFLNKAFAFVRR
ncbi:MAG: methionine synthase [Chlorogloea purpurea SAG 13.99]|jgi:hypothetical protein|nr:methionine synthase [Chlorogloea purpurea SAG 13.99]